MAQVPHAPDYMKEGHKTINTTGTCYLGRSKVQLSTKKVQLFACATAHKGKIGRSYMLNKGAARFASRAFLWALDLPMLPSCAVAQTKSWSFLVQSWTFDRPEY